MTYDRWARPNLPAVRGAEPGQVIIQTGDPRYCWNPFRHDSHEFHYTLDDGTTGGYYCHGEPAFIDIAPPKP